MVLDRESEGGQSIASPRCFFDFQVGSFYGTSVFILIAADRRARPISTYMELEKIMIERRGFVYTLNLQHASFLIDQHLFYIV